METIVRVKKSDPAGGDWCVQGKEINIRVDASSLAIGVLLEKNGAVIEEACLLQPMNDAAHINLAELDAVLKGVNLALQWQVKKWHMRTGSLCVHHWVSDTLTSKARMCTKASSEMLIRRRLSTVKKLADEYELSMDVTLVTMICNLTDGLSWVPQRWFNSIKKGDEPVLPVCAASMKEPDEITKIHHLSRHLGVRRTCYFMQQTNPPVSTSTIRAVVKEYQKYHSIDLAPVKSQNGKLGVSSTWSRLAMDITHYSRQHFLTLIDSGPSRFAVWQPLLWQDSTSVIRQLVFYERGLPEEILTDNNAAFHSRSVSWTNGGSTDVHMFQVASA